MLALFAPMLAGCSLFDPQGSLTLRDVANAEYDVPDVTTQAEEITDAAVTRVLVLAGLLASGTILFSAGVVLRPIWS